MEAANKIRKNLNGHYCLKKKIVFSDFFLKTFEYISNWFGKNMERTFYVRSYSCVKHYFVIIICTANMIN